MLLIHKLPRPCLCYATVDKLTFTIAIGASAQLARECKEVDSTLLATFTASKLRELWEIELRILNEAPRFKELNALRNLGKLFPSERNGMDYDLLGHMVLCLCEHHKTWKK